MKMQDSNEEITSAYSQILRVVLRTPCERQTPNGER
jgi:hypothetical protein